MAGRGIADSTRRTYRYYALRFHSDTCLTPRRPTVDAVTAYVAELNGGGVSKATSSRRSAPPSPSCMSGGTFRSTRPPASRSARRGT
jgi:hypothetical protein